MTDFNKAMTEAAEKYSTSKYCRSDFKDGAQFARTFTLNEMQVLVDVLTGIADQARSAITQRHMLGEVDNTFDFVVSKLEQDARQAIAHFNKLKSGE